MNRLVECDGCKQPIYFYPGMIQQIEDGDIQVDYFSCPYCRKKYLAFVSDSEMRELVAERQRVQTQIKMAHQKRFKEKTIRGYEKKLAKIKAKQQKIYPDLKKRGETLLFGEAHTEEEQS